MSLDPYEIAISFSIRFEYTSAEFKHSGIVAMADPKKWADKIEKERADGAGRKHHAQAALLAHCQILNEAAPKLWAAVRRAFEDFCSAYNEKRDVLCCADVGSKTFTVVRKDFQNVSLTVQGLAAYRLSVAASMGRAELYELQVFENGRGSVFYVVNGAPTTPEEIAANALRPLAMI